MFPHDFMVSITASSLWYPSVHLCMCLGGVCDCVCKKTKKRVKTWNFPLRNKLIYLLLFLTSLSVYAWTHLIRLCFSDLLQVLELPGCIRRVELHQIPHSDCSLRGLPQVPQLPYGLQVFPQRPEPHQHPAPSADWRTGQVRGCRHGTLL